jgi:hypothetical protein
VDEARDAYREGVRGGSCPRCLLELEELEIERHAVSDRPTVWTFDDADHGVFHPAAVQSYGLIRLGPDAGGRTALVWSILPRAGSQDRLVFALSGGARAILLAARPEDAAGALDLVAEDHRGRRYATREPLRFPADAWTELEVLLADLDPLEADDPPLEPGRAVRVEVIDRTGPRRGGAVTWWIDRIEVR